MLRLRLFIHNHHDPCSDDEPIENELVYLPAAPIDESEEVAAIVEPKPSKSKSSVKADDNDEDRKRKASVWAMMITLRSVSDQLHCRATGIREASATSDSGVNCVIYFPRCYCHVICSVFSEFHTARILLHCF